MKYDILRKKHTVERKTFWDQFHTSRKSDQHTKAYNKRIAEIYKSTIPEGMNILELGCGIKPIFMGLNCRIGVGIDFSSEALNFCKNKYPQYKFYEKDVHEIDAFDVEFDYIIVSDLLCDLWDIQRVLLQISNNCSPHTKIIFNYYSHLWDVPLKVLRSFGLANNSLLQNWVSPDDVENFFKISGYERIRSWREILIPISVPLLSEFFNKYLVRIFPFNHLALCNFCIAKPLTFHNLKELSVSIIIPARNESGHIQELVSRIPHMGTAMEIIFVEGNSTDDTYEVISEYVDRNPSICKLIKQPGKGKGDAVRAAFEIATGDILMILDADISVQPEDLVKFYNLIAKGDAEFVNGVRLVYPMEDKAMRFLNLLGNKFFSNAFGWLMGQKIRDTLCGTKVLKRVDYKKIADNRKFFGDFDPFGDFDLLFGAFKQNLKIIEMPIRYNARTYGETNISRWSHGYLLLRMVIFAAKKIKFV